MSLRDSLLNFFKDPSASAHDVDAADRVLWLEALTWAEQTIQAKGVRPLRPAQIAAWKGMADARVALLLGPPGTGKTFGLSWLITGYAEARRSAGLPCRVLVTAFTRAAITNAMEEVEKRVVQFCSSPLPLFYLTRERLPQLGQTIEQVTDPRDFAERLQREQHLVCGTTVWQLAKLLEEQSESFGGDERTAPIFDFVCVDESSQILVAQGLMALAALKPKGRILAAGDNKQLGPIRSVTDNKKDVRGLAGSLYDFLQKAKVPEFTLNETFRLNEPLATFPEQRFYTGGYVAAEPDKRLSLPDKWEERLSANWLRMALRPDIPIFIILHDGPATGTSSPFEAHLVERLCVALLHALHPESLGTNGAAHSASPETLRKFWEHELAVISPHRHQNAAIRELLRRRGLGDECVVETVDRIQGRERDAIVASYTVGDPEFALAEAEFIFDPARLNVTVTRAKTKLIVIVNRRLLETIPADEETFQKAQLLREFVFASEELANTTLKGPVGEDVPVSLRVRRFDASIDLPILEPDPPPPLPQIEVPQLEPKHERVLAAVEEISRESKYRSAAEDQIRKVTAIRKEELFPVLRDLFLAGKISLLKRTSQFGDFWVAEPKADGIPYPLTVEEVKARITRVIEDVRSGSWSPKYVAVRARFAWVDSNGEDGFLPIARSLEKAGILVFDKTEKGIDTLDLARRVSMTGQNGPAIPAPAVALVEQDFVVLNGLEDLEQRRFNFGIFEAWTTTPELTVALRESSSDAPTSWEAVHTSLERLAAHGYVLFTAEGRVRSRMAEMGRELRYIKQRFRPGDSKERPYLVRGIKIQTRTRERPLFDKAVSDLVARLGNELQSVHGASTALKALSKMLAARFDTSTPQLAGFQARALEEILRAWFGLSGTEGFVVTAETGSGKTEAALLPILVGAAVDRMQGIKGPRAIFVYPRVRLAANQAQRFAGYAQALSAIEGMPMITVGLQSSPVPSSAEWAKPEEGWERVGGGSARTFPLFGCPSCAGQLSIFPGQGMEGADRLCCTKCSWVYDGWVGFKARLRESPPALFVSVTESLHQWQHDPEAARLFGDVAGYAAPRAVVADEIHLFTHVHGAQLGWMLRRLLARAALSPPPEGRPERPLAIGMSATLSDAPTIWAMLSGRPAPHELRPDECERVPNPKGREYFFFIQSEVESRGKDIAGASTTIQSLMCLSHNMRRRREDQTGFRGIAFFDSIDKLKRLHTAYIDAEEVQRLPKLRTFSYVDATATSSPPRDECCGDPSGCDTFYDGECWYFAATDRHQVTAKGRYEPPCALKICWRPVFSGTSGNVDRDIAKSDLVFATSSLEVGYDDPDIGLVYQHYAPVNLASFIQRKGRGGRGADDRSITGITLTPYSPRDSWFFRRPDEMLNPDGFRIPLNLDNHFVRRGQLLTLMLDVASKLVATGRKLSAHDMPDVFFDEVERHLEEIFGSEILRELGHDDARSFWRGALETVAEAGKSVGNGPKEWRESFPWVPKPLFGTINLPELDVVFPSSRDAHPRTEPEDISLVLSDCAPGNMSRRFDDAYVHWVPPFEGDGMWLIRDDYVNARALDLPSGVAGVLAALPDASRGDIERGELGVHDAAVRPLRVTLSSGGIMRGSEFIPHWRFDPTKREFQLIPREATAAEPPKGSFDVMHESRSILRGATLIEPTAPSADVRSVAGCEALISKVEIFTGMSGGAPTTGLALTSVVWGADVSLRIDRRGESRETLRQRFIHPSTGKVLLHGYRVETEGIRCALNSETLDSFVESFKVEVAATPLERWLHTQLLALLVHLHGTAKGIDGFSLQLLAELFASASGDVATELRRSVARFNADRLMTVLRGIHQRSLSHHPLISERRLEKIRETISTAGPLFRAVFEDFGKAEIVERYYRSLVLHGLAVRLHQAFVRLGAGDERRVAAHVVLPILSSNIPEGLRDVVSIAERGEHGDGTTRAFAEHLTEAFQDLLNHDSFCLNAAEDSLVAEATRNEPRESWSHLDPRKENDVRAVLDRFGVRALVEGGVSAQHLLRTVFGREFVGGEEFRLLDLDREARALFRSLESQLGRPGRVWELISGVLENAASEAPAEPTPRLHALLAAFRGLPNEQTEDGSRSAEDRLADQVYRLSAPLCIDGCLSCLGAGAGVVQSSWTDVTTSRQTLERFLAFARQRC